VLAGIDVRDADWRLGNYQILEEIGRGGMGVIYRARQRHSRRIVAVKRILSYHADSQETLVRFRREAEAAARLDHPNILPIYEVGENEDGLPSFSMKFASGGSLLDAGPALRNEPRININTAAAHELESLPGIGETMAARIVSHRERYGAFRRAEHLMMVRGISQVVTGQRPVSELGGPIKIVKFSGEQLSLGWVQFAWLVAMISINLAFINLLPIPALDGGHLAFYAAEAVRRKPASPRSQEWAFRTGIAFVLALMLFVTINDVVSLLPFGR